MISPANPDFRNSLVFVRLLRRPSATLRAGFEEVPFQNAGSHRNCMVPDP